MRASCRRGRRQEKRRSVVCETTPFTPSRRQSESAMRSLVLGNGRSGQAAAALLRREGWEVRILDGNDSWPVGEWNLCVTSPGIPLTHPWQVAARAAGVPVISELQLGAERYRARGGRMLAVTGSKGKSSVVKLVADALGGIPCGNYGTPLCEVVCSCQLKAPQPSTTLGRGGGEQFPDGDDRSAARYF